MNEKQSIQSCGPDFGVKCAALLRANSEVVSEMLGTLPASRLEALDALLAGGGRIGIECVIDAMGANHISLIGLEVEGARLVLATVTQPAAYAKQ